ncbi:MAG: hypothetical protein KBD82_20660 [Rhodoferax sp.]|jgi:hypothetical protein|uniref:hypothetical protein n=1 Tax=Rhodoferax sp. TaxID=50421 RepID=UPI001B3ED62F|nr:hypothetical protein [Rhodoferax sp.]MBP9738045.1 hypothetical protein [Rhodoferax sp.]
MTAPPVHNGQAQPVELRDTLVPGSRQLSWPLDDNYLGRSEAGNELGIGIWLSGFFESF